MQKPSLSVLRILGMCFGFFGIQIGFALQTGHFSRVFETLGADVNDLAILWIAAPMTGLIVQPIVGYLSDRTWTRLGRRRPYFTIGAILTSLGLLVMPTSSAVWMAAGMLWLIDSSLNITMEPFRAFVGDMLPVRQRATGFAAQAFFIGAGGTLGSALPWMLENWFGFSSAPIEGHLPENIQMMFYVGAGLLFLAVMITVLTTREYDSETLAAYEAAEAAAAGKQTTALKPRPAAPSASTWLAFGIGFLVAGLGFSAAVYVMGWAKELYVLGGGLAVFGILQVIAASRKSSDGPTGAFSEIMEDMFRLPKTMRQLAVVQFFSWFAMFSMWIYLNRGLIDHQYGGLTPDMPAYQEAANWIGLNNAVYFAVAAIIAFLIPPIARATSQKGAHALCLLAGAAGFASFYFNRDPDFLWVSMIGVGIVWASILSMPYAILSNALPADKMGIYMGIFNFFIVIPQLVAASILGLIVTSLFDGQAIYALLVGAASFVLAAIFSLMVDDPGDSLAKDKA